MKMQAIKWWRDGWQETASVTPRVDEHRDRDWVTLVHTADRLPVCWTVIATKSRVEFNAQWKLLPDAPLTCSEARKLVEGKKIYMAQRPLDDRTVELLVKPVTNPRRRK